MNEIDEGNGTRDLRGDLRDPTGLLAFHRGRVSEVWSQQKGSKGVKLSKNRCLRHAQISQDRQNKGKQDNTRSEDVYLPYTKLFGHQSRSGARDFHRLRDMEMRN